MNTPSGFSVDHKSKPLISWASGMPVTSFNGNFTPPAQAPAGGHVKMIEWLHSCLNGAGHCIDGGKCHHSASCAQNGECWRQRSCVPLSGSGLTDDWRIPGAR